MLTTSEAEELRALLPVARTARRQHTPESPQGRASSRVTEILASAFSENRATVRQLSDATGISYHSVARRVRIATGENVGRASKAAQAEVVAETEGAAATAPIDPSHGATAENPTPELAPEPPAPEEAAPQTQGENPSGAQEVPAHAPEAGGGDTSSAPTFPPDMPARVGQREVTDVEIPEELAAPEPERRTGWLS